MNPIAQLELNLSAVGEPESSRRYLADNLHLIPRHMIPADLIAGYELACDHAGRPKPNRPAVNTGD